MISSANTAELEITMKRVATGLLLIATLTMAGQAAAWGGGRGHGGHGGHGGHRGGGNVAGALIGGAVIGALLGSAATRYYEPPVVYSAPQPVYVPPPQVVYEAPPAVVYVRPRERCFDTYLQEYVPCYAPRPRHRDYPPADYYYGR
jgi:hypothetical protein